MTQSETASPDTLSVKMTWNAPARLKPGNRPDVPRAHGGRQVMKKKSKRKGESGRSNKNANMSDPSRQSTEGSGAVLRKSFTSRVRSARVAARNQLDEDAKKAEEEVEKVKKSKKLVRRTGSEVKRDLRHTGRTLGSRLRESGDANDPSPTRSAIHRSNREIRADREAAANAPAKSYCMDCCVPPSTPNALRDEEDSPRPLLQWTSLPAIHETENHPFPSPVAQNTPPKTSIPALDCNPDAMPPNTVRVSGDGPPTRTFNESSGILLCEELAVHIALFLVPPSATPQLSQDLQTWGKTDHSGLKRNNLFIRITNVLTWHKTKLFRVFAILGKGFKSADKVKAKLHEIEKKFKLMDHAVCDHENDDDRARHRNSQMRKDSHIFLKWIGKDGLQTLLRNDYDPDIAVKTSTQADIYIHNGQRVGNMPNSKNNADTGSVLPSTGDESLMTTPKTTM